MAGVVSLIIFTTLILTQHQMYSTLGVTTSVLALIGIAVWMVLSLGAIAKLPNSARKEENKTLTRKIFFPIQLLQLVLIVNVVVAVINRSTIVVS